MDRLTRQEIEDERDAAQTLLDESPTAPSFVLDRLRFKIRLCDLALSALSHEAVRDEALEEAKCIALAIDSGRGNEKEIVKAIEALKREPNASYSELGRDDDAPRRDFEREQYERAEREPNAAGQASGSSERTMASANPAPAAPDVAEKWVFWEKSDGYAVGPRNVGALAVVFTWDEAVALCKAANALLARLGQGWIPVSERLPEGDGQVLVTYNTGGADVLTRQAVRNLYEAAEIEGDGECFITHWMPLPPASWSLR